MSMTTTDIFGDRTELDLLLIKLYIKEKLCIMEIKQYLKEKYHVNLSYHAIRTAILDTGISLRRIHDAKKIEWQRRKGLIQ